MFKAELNSDHKEERRDRGINVYSEVTSLVKWEGRVIFH